MFNSGADWLNVNSVLVPVFLDADVKMAPVFERNLPPTLTFWLDFSK